MIAIDEIQQMPLHEKLVVMEAIWSDISRVEASIDVPQWHRDLLDEREALISEGKAQFTEWDDAKEQIEAATR